MIEEQVKRLTKELIQKGTTYDIDFLKKVYAEQLKFIRIAPDDSVEILSKQDNLDFFQGLKDRNAEPLNQEHKILFADNDGEIGNIVLKRRMHQLEEEQDFIFNITWKNTNGNWQIIREVVTVLA